MGCGPSRPTVHDAAVHEPDELAAAYERARAKVLKAGGTKTATALAHALLEEGTKANDDAVTVTVADEDTLKALGKAASDGMSVTNYSKEVRVADADVVAGAKAIAPGMDRKKN